MASLESPLPAVDYNCVGAVLSDTSLTLKERIIAVTAFVKKHSAAAAVSEFFAMSGDSPFVDHQQDVGGAADAVLDGRAGDGHGQVFNPNAPVPVSWPGEDTMNVLPLHYLLAWDVSVAHDAESTETPSSLDAPSTTVAGSKTPTNTATPLQRAQAAYNELAPYYIDLIDAFVAAGVDLTAADEQLITFRPHDAPEDHGKYLEGGCTVLHYALRYHGLLVVMHLMAALKAKGLVGQLMDKRHDAGETPLGALMQVYLAMPLPHAPAAGGAAVAESECPPLPPLPLTGLGRMPMVGLVELINLFFAEYEIDLTKYGHRVIDMLLAGTVLPEVYSAAFLRILALHPNTLLPRKGPYAHEFPLHHMLFVMSGAHWSRTRCDFDSSADPRDIFLDRWSLPIIEAMLDTGVIPVNAKDRYGNTLLLKACATVGRDRQLLNNGGVNYDIVELLLRRGADPTIRSDDGQSPLFQVIKSLIGDECYHCLNLIDLFFTAKNPVTGATYLDPSMIEGEGRLTRDRRVQPDAWRRPARRSLVELVCSQLYQYPPPSDDKSMGLFPLRLDILRRLAIYGAHNMPLQVAKLVPRLLPLDEVAEEQLPFVHEDETRAPLRTFFDYYREADWSPVCKQPRAMGAVHWPPVHRSAHDDVDFADTVKTDGDDDNAAANSEEDDDGDDAASPIEDPHAFLGDIFYDDDDAEEEDTNPPPPPSAVESPFVDAYRMTRNLSVTLPDGEEDAPLNTILALCLNRPLRRYLLPTPTPIVREGYYAHNHSGAATADRAATLEELFQLIDTFVANGYDINRVGGPHRCTALMVVCDTPAAYGNGQMVPLALPIILKLLAVGANPNIPNLFGQYPLHQLVTAMCAEYMPTAVAHHEPLTDDEDNSSTTGGNTSKPYSSVDRIAEFASVVEAFVKAGADVNQYDWAGTTPFRIACGCYGGGHYTPIHYLNAFYQQRWYGQTTVSSTSEFHCAPATSFTFSNFNALPAVVKVMLECGNADPRKPHGPFMPRAIDGTVAASPAAVAGNSSRGTVSFPAPADGGAGVDNAYLNRLYNPLGARLFSMPRKVCPAFEDGATTDAFHAFMGIAGRRVNATTPPSSSSSAVAANLSAAVDSTAVPSAPPRRPFSGIGATSLSAEDGLSILDLFGKRGAVGIDPSAMSALDTEHNAAYSDRIAAVGLLRTPPTAQTTSEASQPQASSSSNAETTNVVNTPSIPAATQAADPSAPIDASAGAAGQLKVNNTPDNDDDNADDSGSSDDEESDDSDDSSEEDEDDSDDSDEEDDSASDDDDSEGEGGSDDDDEQRAPHRTTLMSGVVNNEVSTNPNNNASSAFTCFVDDETDAAIRVGGDAVVSGEEEKHGGGGESSNDNELHPSAAAPTPAAVIAEGETAASTSDAAAEASDNAAAPLDPAARAAKIQFDNRKQLMLCQNLITTCLGSPMAHETIYKLLQSVTGVGCASPSALADLDEDARKHRLAVVAKLTTALILFLENLHLKPSYMTDTTYERHLPRQPPASTTAQTDDSPQPSDPPADADAGPPPVRSLRTEGPIPPVTFIQIIDAFLERGADVNGRFPAPVNANSSSSARPIDPNAPPHFTQVAAFDGTHVVPFTPLTAALRSLRTLGTSYLYTAFRIRGKEFKYFSPNWRARPIIFAVQHLLSKGADPKIGDPSTGLIPLHLLVASAVCLCRDIELVLPTTLLSPKTNLPVRTPGVVGTLPAVIVEPTKVMLLDLIRAMVVDYRVDVNCATTRDGLGIMTKLLMEAWRWGHNTQTSPPEVVLKRGRVLKRLKLAEKALANGKPEPEIPPTYEKCILHTVYRNLLLSAGFFRVVDLLIALGADLVSRTNVSPSGAFDPVAVPASIIRLIAVSRTIIPFTGEATMPCYDALETSTVGLLETLARTMDQTSSNGRRAVAQSTVESTNDAADKERLRRNVFVLLFVACTGDSLDTGLVSALLGLGRSVLSDDRFLKSIAFLSVGAKGIVDFIGEEYTRKEGGKCRDATVYHTDSPWLRTRDYYREYSPLNQFIRLCIRKLVPQASLDQALPTLSLFIECGASVMAHDLPYCNGGVVSKTLFTAMNAYFICLHSVFYSTDKSSALRKKLFVTRKLEVIKILRIVIQEGDMDCHKSASPTCGGYTAEAPLLHVIRAFSHDVFGIYPGTGGRQQHRYVPSPLIPDIGRQYRMYPGECCSFESQFSNEVFMTDLIEIIHNGSIRGGCPSAIHTATKGKSATPKTPLVLACELGNVYAVIKLLSLGAKPPPVTPSAYVATDYARKFAPVVHVAQHNPLAFASHSLLVTFLDGIARALVKVSDPRLNEALNVDPLPIFGSTAKYYSHLSTYCMPNRPTSNGDKYSRLRRFCLMTATNHMLMPTTAVATDFIKKALVLLIEALAEVSKVTIERIVNLADDALGVMTPLAVALTATPIVSGQHLMRRGERFEFLHSHNVVVYSGILQALLSCGASVDPLKRLCFGRSANPKHQEQMHMRAHNKSNNHHINNSNNNNNLLLQQQDARILPGGKTKDERRQLNREFVQNRKGSGNPNPHRMRQSYDAALDSADPLAVGGPMGNIRDRNAVMKASRDRREVEGWSDDSDDAPSSTRPPRPLAMEDYIVEVRRRIRAMPPNLLAILTDNTEFKESDLYF